MDAGKKSDQMSLDMVNGKANVVDVVTAISQTQLAMESMVAVRDKNADLAVGGTGITTMDGAQILDIGRDGIWVMILVAAPIMTVGLVVGIVIALFQALTQIQEQTLVFVPKILAIFVTMVIALPFMGATMRMISLNWLPSTAYFYILIFARVGSILMLIPALGEMTIPARMRLSFGLVFSLVLYPLIVPSLPPLPENVLTILVYLLHELAIGLIIGAITRLVTMAAAVAGSVIAYQTGLSGAQGPDPINGGAQGALIGAFLSMLGVTLIFATNLHHVALMAIRDSYMIFSPRE
eukprot:gene10056-13545_t